MLDASLFCPSSQTFNFFRARFRRPRIRVQRQEVLEIGLAGVAAPCIELNGENFQRNCDAWGGDDHGSAIARQLLAHVA